MRKPIKVEVLAEINGQILSGISPTKSQLKEALRELTEKALSMYPQHDGEIHFVVPPEGEKARQTNLNVNRGKVRDFQYRQASSRAWYTPVSFYKV